MRVRDVRDRRKRHTGKGCWSRRSVLAALAALGTVGLFAHGACARVETNEHPLSAEESEQVRRIEAYLNSIDTVQADFVQASSTGEQARGVLYLERPGRMRIEYAPPKSILLVANGTFLILHDRNLDQVSYLPLELTPASILLEPKVTLDSAKVMVTDFAVNDAGMAVTVAQREDPAAGNLALIFRKDPLQLEQWVVFDPQGIMTSVQLLDAHFGVALDPELFKFENPKFSEEQPRRDN